VLWLVVVSVLSGTPADDPALPLALPPLDDALLTDDGDVHAFGHGRVRAVGEDGDVDFAGAGLTARVGARGAVGDVRGSVVVGDGGWWVAPTRPTTTTTTELAPTTLTLARPPLLSLVQRLSVEVPLSPLGSPGQLVLGRFPLVIADGRYIGAESFDGRGRTVDGAVVEAGVGAVVVKAGVVALDLGAGRDDDHDGRADEDAVSPFDAAGFVDAAVSVDDGVFDDVRVDAYVVAHHAAPTLSPTLGARAAIDAWGLRWQAGVDAQLALDETEGLQRTGGGLHGELRARTLLPWTLPTPRPFLEVGGEATGDVTAPAPTQHGFFGALDLVGLHDTAQLFSRVGVDDDTGFAAAVGWRVVGSLDDDGFVDPRGRALALGDGATPLARFAEIDVDLTVPVADAVDVDVGWAVAIDDVGLRAQRVLIGLQFSFGDDDGLLPPL